MIVIDKDAAEYIKKHLSVVIIELKLEPAIGGCACAGKSVTGSYVPYIYIDKTGEVKEKKYCSTEINSIIVYYPENLRIKEGYQEIRIKLKKIMFLEWLEIEGAKAIAIYN